MSLIVAVCWQVQFSTASTNTNVNDFLGLRWRELFYDTLTPSHFVFACVTSLLVTEVPNSSRSAALSEPALAYFGLLTGKDGRCRARHKKIHIRYVQTKHFSACFNPVMLGCKLKAVSSYALFLCCLSVFFFS
ncbi:hypothetical protein BDB00DRAFT_822238 [Zychaea mexicana]|uniref:uncharacterized protein n=1 Tax=Zychaea mexicana TaxID=64656 RepID=UPI0022FEC982|nr:uncharacterized protein BDB00DRAFT_822238 [Zychaea mexicana]KAI9493711.1 hypothetical protein BDB00DRAFT_822238 [Zychaea mexicana]